MRIRHPNNAEQADAERQPKSYQPMIRWDGKGRKTRVSIQHPENCQVSTGCTANHSVIVERQVREYECSVNSYQLSK